MMKLGEIFRKDLTRDAHGRGSVWGGAMAFEQAPLGYGIVAGTQLATQNGWRNVEALQEGDSVLTFDDGLQVVRRLTRRWSYLELDKAPMRFWPLHVPAGALGNKNAMTVLPDQPVMVESDLGEDMYGDPFTLVPAQALDGLKGIEHRRPQAPVEIVTLEFDTEQVVFANGGALFHCTAESEMSIASLLEERSHHGYEILSAAQARAFVDAMRKEARLDAAWIQAQYAQRAACQVSYG